MPGKYLHALVVIALLIAGKIFPADVTSVSGTPDDSDVPAQLIEVEYQAGEEQLPRILATEAFRQSQANGAPVLACPGASPAQCSPIETKTDLEAILEKSRAPETQGIASTAATKAAPNNKLRFGILRFFMNGGITATIFLVRGVPGFTSLKMGLGVGLWSFLHQMIAPSYVQWLYYRNWIPQFRIARPRTAEDRQALREANRSSGIKRRFYIITHVHVPPPTEKQKAGRWTPILKNFAVAVVFNTGLRAAVYHYGVDPHMFDGIEATVWTVLNTLAISPTSAVWMEYFPQRISAMVARAILKVHPEREAAVKAWQNRVAFAQSGTVVATTVADNMLGKAWGSVAKFLVGLGGAAIYNKETVNEWWGHVPDPLRTRAEKIGSRVKEVCQGAFNFFW